MCHGTPVPLQPADRGVHFLGRPAEASARVGSGQTATYETVYACQLYNFQVNFLEFFVHASIVYEILLGLIFPRSRMCALCVHGCVVVRTKSVESFRKHGTCCLAIGRRPWRSRGPWRRKDLLSSFSALCRFFRSPSRILAGSPSSHGIRSKQVYQKKIYMMFLGLSLFKLFRPKVELGV